MRFLRSLAVSSVLAIVVFAADGDRTVVKLHIVRGVAAPTGWGIDFNQARGERVIAAPGTERSGKLPRATVLATPEHPGSYRLVIKSQDGGDAITTTISPKEPALIELPRKAGKLPYRIEMDANAGPDNLPAEHLGWAADYRAEGTLASGTCKTLLVVWDMNTDGLFNRGDMAQGTSIGIDLDGDGKIFGRREYIKGGEVFQFCGKAFFVDPDSLEQDGSAVTVVETSLTPPKLGEKVPTLALQTTRGETLHSEDWKGMVVVLDFWASWCGYCIEGFSILKEMRTQLGSDLQIISINTDEPTAISAANRVLREHALPWPSVLSAKGLNDPVWMLFQALDHSLPLYAILDRQGIVRYSGSGGEKLMELRNTLEKLIPGRLNY